MRRCSARSTTSSSAGASRPLRCCPASTAAGGRDRQPAQRVDGPAPHRAPTRSTSRTTEERERPPAWRFWRALPPQGQARDLLRRLVHEPLVRRAAGRDRRRRPAPARCRRSGASRRMLRRRGRRCCSSSGSTSPQEQRERLKELRGRSADALARDRATTGSSCKTLRPLPRRLRSTFCARPAPARRRGSIVGGADPRYRDAHRRPDPARRDPRARSTTSRSAGAPVTAAPLASRRRRRLKVLRALRPDRSDSIKRRLPRSSSPSSRRALPASRGASIRQARRW